MLRGEREVFSEQAVVKVRFFDERDGLRHPGGFTALYMEASNLQEWDGQRRFN